MSTYDQVYGIIKTLYPMLPEMNWYTTYEESGLDSLDGIEIIMAIEEEFNIEITDEDAEKLKSLGSLVALVDKRIAEKPPVKNEEEIKQEE